MSATAPGFTPAALRFLRELAAHNDRAWFQPRKAEYERVLKEPFAAFCAALGEELSARAIPLESDPFRSPFRIYRDVRFSRDKSPYKTWMAASFPWIGEGSGGGAYFHLEPGNVYLGGGVWHPEAAWLANWRSLVDERGGEVHAALEDPAFLATFGTLDGDRLKRVPSGYPADHPDADLLRLKDVTFGRQLPDESALSPELPALVARTLADAVPVLRLLAGVAAQA